jgi:hypothetical protein
MARYGNTINSTAALAANTGFAWLMGSASGGGFLRRVTLGVLAGATTPTSQQVSVAIARCTNAGTTPTSLTAQNLNPQAGAARMATASAFATPPTVTSPDLWAVTFNTQSGVDLPWEQLEEFAISKAATDGLAFINRTNALPTSHLYTISIEWEE